MSDAFDMPVFRWRIKQCKKIAVLGILICISLLEAGCVKRMVYYPKVEVKNTPADIGLEYTSLRMETSDGIEIAGWWIPSSDADKTVLYFHGNSGNIGDRLDRIRLMNSIELNLLIIDYRGFGKSEGSPTKKGLYRDADAAMLYLSGKKSLDPESIILWGRSLGGAVAARTAAAHDVKMLILESTFISIKEVAKDLCPIIPGWLLKNHSYQTISYLTEIDIPILVIHSVDDEVVALYHAERLYESISAPKQFVELRGSHNDGFVDSMDVYIAGIRAFIGNSEKRLLEKNELEEPLN